MVKGTSNRFGRNSSVISGSIGEGLPPIDDRGTFGNKRSLPNLENEKNKRPVYIDYLQELKTTRAERQ